MVRYELHYYRNGRYFGKWTTDTCTLRELKAIMRGKGGFGENKGSIMILYKMQEVARAKYSMRHLRLIQQDKEKK